MVRNTQRLFAFINHLEADHSANKSLLPPAACVVIVQVFSNSNLVLCVFQGLFDCHHRYMCMIIDNDSSSSSKKRKL